MCNRIRPYLLAILAYVIRFAGCWRTSESEASHTEASVALRTESVEPRLKLELGEPIDLTQETRTQVLVSSAQVEPSCDVVQDGVSFTVGVRDGRIVFVSCGYEGFELPGGEVIGVTRFKDLTDSQREQVVEEPGWAFYTSSEQGWNLAWMESPSDDDVVLWAFKR